MKLQTQVSYTWSHSIDSASNDAGGGFANITGTGDRGDSDFDIRHNLNWSGSYRLSSPENRYAHLLLGNWNADWVASARTSLRFEVQGVTSGTSDLQSAGALNIRTGLFA